ncbi:hypothetical protein [Mycobacterium kansasii]|uniref:hypothetical protein n=1 Tax=Mycobacterium kansasii TaxID=1768 RepID=UPI0021561711|nr:hypothetical protein [Mycobacterium kansasii]
MADPGLDGRHEKFVENRVDTAIESANRFMPSGASSSTSPGSNSPTAPGLKKSLAASARLVPYVETAAPCSPAEHLSQLLAQLADRGFTVYLDEAHRLSNGITAVHGHIPRLERFHMIVDGPATVVPGRRESPPSR